MTLNEMFNIGVLPAGEYFVGDVCYFLQDNLMKDVWSSKFYYTDGVGFAIIKPVAGNGLYAGSNKFIYDVEMMNLGVVPVALGDKSKFTGCGTFHNFDKPVAVSITNNGVATIQSGSWSLEIDTSDSESTHYDDEGYDSWG